MISILWIYFSCKVYKGNAWSKVNKNIPHGWWSSRYGKRKNTKGGNRLSMNMRHSLIASNYLNMIQYSRTFLCYTYYTNTIRYISRAIRGKTFKGTSHKASGKVLWNYRSHGANVASAITIQNKSIQEYIPNLKGIICFLTSIYLHAVIINELRHDDISGNSHNLPGSYIQASIPRR